MKKLLITLIALLVFGALFAVPLTESFDDATFPPAGWTNIRTAGTGSPGVWDRQTSGTFPTTAPYSGAGMIRYNCYSLASGTTGILVTPPLNFPDDEYRVSFWMYRDPGFSTNTDRVNVYYNTTNSATGGTLLGTINRSTTLAPAVAAAGWYNYKFAMPAGAAGNSRHIVFEAVSAYGNNIFMDHVVIEEIPVTPIFSLNPSSISFALTAENAYSPYTNVVVSNIGVGTLNLATGDISLIGANADQFGFTTADLPAALTASQSVNIPVRFEPTSVGEKTATLQINYGGVDYDVALSGRAYSSTALYESFESTPFPPAGWANPGSWSRSTSYFSEGLASAYKWTSSAESILSTPMLSILGDSSVMFMARTASTNANQRIQVKYSADRVTWTSIGDPIALASNSSFALFNVDLSTLAGFNYYIGFAAYNAGTSGSVYLDQVLAPAATPLAPDPVTLVNPANAATAVNELPTFSWTAASTGGIPTGYNIYLDTVDGRTLYASDVSSPYTLTTALAYNTMYFWTVAAYNENGEGDPAAVRSFTTRPDPIVSTFPWFEDFGTTTSYPFPPTNWTRRSGLYPDASGTSSQWFMDDWLNVTTPANKAARTNILGTARNGWLITPGINIPTTGYELQFDLGLTVANGTGAVDPLQQLDDKFIVLVADNPLMTGATILQEWNNSGSASVFNAIPNTGTTVTLELDDYLGIQYFAFYGESTVTGGSSDLFVDNVTVRETPMAGLLLVNPNPIVCGSTYVGTSTTTQVSFTNTGVAPFAVNTIALENTTNFQLANLPMLPFTINPGDPAVTFEVLFNPSSPGALSTNLLVGDTRLNPSFVVSGTGVEVQVGEICENPYIATLPVVDYAGSTAGYNNDYTSAMFTGLGSTYYVNGKDWVAQVTIPEAGWLSASIANPPSTTTSQYMGIFLVNTIPSIQSPATVLAQAYGASGPNAFTGIDVGPGTYYLIIDNWPSPAEINFILNVSFEAYPDVMYPSALVTTGVTGDSADLGWTDMNDPAATEWDILWGAPGFDIENEGTLIAGVSTNPYTLSALSPSTPYSWYVRAVIAETESDWAGPANFTTAQIPATLPLAEGWESGQGEWTIVNGTQTNAWYIDTADPYDGSYSAYISNDSGLSNAYTINAASAVHLYRDIALTDDSLEFQLSFMWKAAGESSFDFLKVYLVDTSVLPVAGTQLSSGQIGASIYNQQGTTWQQASITLPGSLSGSVKRLVFSWRNDDSVGTQPPINLDDISLTAVPIPTGPVLAPNLDYPADNQTGLPIAGFPYEFSWNTAGSAPDQYDLYVVALDDLPLGYDVNDFFTYASVFEGSVSPYTPDFTYSYSTTYLWSVIATSEVYVDPVYEWPPYQFTTQPDPRILSLPYSQNFDGVPAPALPAAFVKLGTGTVQTQTTNNYSAPNCLYMYSGVSTTISMLALPDVVLNNVHAKLTFMGRANFTAGGIVQVGYLTDPTDPATFVVIDQVTMASLTYASYEVDLGTINGTMHYALRANPVSPFNSVLIDNLGLVEVVPIDMAVTALTGAGYAFQNTPVTHTVTVKNNGSVAVSNYTVYLKSVDGRAILGQETFTDPLAADATNAVEFTWTPTSLGAMDIYGEVYVADDAVAENNTSELMSFNVYQEGILFEGFEGGVIPANWTVLNADGGTQVWQAQTANPRTGTYAARVRYETSTLDNDDWLITPPLQVTSSTTDNISFWMRTYNGTSADPWQVLISTTDTNPASFTMIDEGDGMLANYVQKSYNLDSYGDAVIYLAVRYMGAFDWYLYVDDFIGPPIFTPTTLATPDVTISTVGSNVVLNWDAIPYATSYEVMAADAPEGPWTLASTVTAPTYSSAATSKKFFKVIAKAGATRSITTQALSLEQQLLQDELDKAARSRQ